MRQLPQFQARRRERGITLIFVVVAIFALLGVAALAIDLVTLYVSKAEAQRVADAAALAGAKASSIAASLPIRPILKTIGPMPAPRPPPRRKVSRRKEKSEASRPRPGTLP